MRSIFILTMILFLFTACTAQPAAPNIAPTATFPPTSTLAPTETTTPTTIPPTAIPETATPLPATAEAPIPQYEVSTLKEFEDLGVPVYEIPTDDPFNGKLLTWLRETQTKPFSDNAKNIPLRSWGNQDWVTYNPSTEPNFPNPEMKPFRIGTVIGHLTSGPIEYLILPIEYKGKDGTSDWIVTSFPISTSSGPFKGKLTPTQIKSEIKKWTASKYPVFIFSTDHKASVLPNDDIVLKSQHLFPNWMKLTEMYIETGSAKSLNQPGLIFDAIIVDKTTR